ncbi:MAG: hypothetical protein GQ531_07055 [Sulfurovum sp.]|nr:hypothetical protein [Sulfurovum sp.]
MSMLRKILFTSILTVGFLGCTQAPALKVYGLSVTAVSQMAHSPYRNKVLQVSYPESLREQMSQKMNFSYSESDYGTYLNSEWSNHMSKLLQGTLMDVLESSKLFKAVLSDSTTLHVNYRLESDIFAFEHRVRGNASYAVVSIQFTLINADTGRLIKSKRFNYKEATLSTNAKGYAHATNVAIAKLNRDLLNWLR